jgi:hypothetical protein
MIQVATWSALVLIPILLLLAAAYFLERAWFLQVTAWYSGALLTTLCLRLYRIHVLRDFDAKFSESISDAVQLGIADAVVACTLAGCLFAGTLWILLRIAPSTTTWNFLSSLVVAVIIATLSEILFQRHSLLILCISAIICALALRSLTDKLRV